MYRLTKKEMAAKVSRCFKSRYYSVLGYEHTSDLSIYSCQGESAYSAFCDWCPLYYPCLRLSWFRRERCQHLSEAVIKLDRFHNSLKQRKRCRIESSPTQRPAGSNQVTKAPNSSSITYTLDPISQQKGGDKAKSGIINKRVRTSLADVRV